MWMWWRRELWRQRLRYVRRRLARLCDDCGRTCLGSAGVVRQLYLADLVDHVVCGLAAPIVIKGSLIAPFQGVLVAVTARVSARTDCLRVVCRHTRTSVHRSHDEAHDTAYVAFHSIQSYLLVRHVGILTRPQRVL